MSLVGVQSLPSHGVPQSTDRLDLQSTGKPFVPPNTSTRHNTH